jgi:hypothetical protein
MTARIHPAFAAIFAIVGAAAAPSAWAGRITLNDTGMTQCIDRRVEWTSECTKSGQDAADGRDVDVADPDDGLAGFSFRKVCRSGQMAGDGSCPTDPVIGNGPDDWGCTYDNVTQLTWEMKTNDGGLHHYLRRFTNKGGKAQDLPSDAANLVKATNAEALCGSTDWRLPDPIELQSIVDYGGGTPDHRDCIDPTFFPNPEASYWTRTESAWDTKSAWYVQACGRISGTKRFTESEGARVVHRKPRTLSQGKAAIAKERFIPSVDGTEVTDTMTGLVWRRCAEGMVWSGDAQACTGTATRYHWQDAFDHVRANREGGWRLPNIKELFSIVDFERLGPALDPLAFPNAPGSGFLSATPVDSGGVVYFKTVYFSRGDVDQQEAYQGNTWPLRLVRRGRK